MFFCSSVRCYSVLANRLATRFLYPIHHGVQLARTCFGGAVAKLGHDTGWNYKLTISKTSRLALTNDSRDRITNSIAGSFQ
jgi:hypothetical protein